MKKLIFFLLLLFLTIGSAYSQIDTVFWFAAPDITAGHAHTPITICVASFANPATVTISQPANASFAPVIINLNAYSFYSLDVTSMESIIETTPANTVCNTGIQIVSTEKISAYYQLTNCNSEIYTLKGQNALGTDFIVPMQYLLDNGGFYPTPYSSIEIVATEPNTVVTITPSQPLFGGAPANVPITVTLNVGQTYAIKSAGQSGSSHLRNTRISSNKPIAVNSSDDSVYASSGGEDGTDLIGEQIVPTTLAGNTFIAIWNYNSYESVFVFPTQNNTNVYINGNTTPVATLNIGDEYMYTLTTPATLITSDKPVFVFQLTGVGGEVGGTVLPGLACTGSQEVIYARPSYSTDMKVTIVTQSININGFTLNGSAANIDASDFITLPYDPVWSYCIKDMSSLIPTSSVMMIANNGGNFHMGILDSYGSGTCSIGYFSDYNHSGKIKFIMQRDYCLHDEITFNYVGTGVDNIKLITPAGDTLTQEPFIINSADITDTGKYYIIAHDTSNCVENLMDSIDIHIINFYKPDLGEDTSICEGEMFYLDSQYEVPNTSYYWNTGSTDSGIYIISGGDYILNVSSVYSQTNIACSGGADTVHVFIYPHPVIDFSADKTEGCAPQKITFTNLTLPDSVGMNYFWSVYDLDGSLVASSTVENPDFEFTESGTYHVQLVAISENGCSDSLMKWNYIHIYPQPVAEFAADPEISMLSDNGGVVNFSSYLSSNVLENPETDYLWDFGDGTVDTTDYTPSHTYETWGDYVVTLHIETQGGCSDEVSHWVIIEDDLEFPNVITPNGDGLNDVFAIKNLNTDINPEDPDEYRTNMLTIYDRWGKLVYQVDNYDTFMKDDQLFTGLKYFDGKDLSDGVYYYTFYYKGKAKITNYHGTITIIRQNP